MCDLPDGLSGNHRVQTLGEKYSALPVGQIIFTNSPRPASTTGAFRDRHGRGVRDAMDVDSALDE
jgi:hypothetical protein